MSRKKPRLDALIHTNVSPQHIGQTKRPLFSFIGELLANAYDAARSSSSSSSSSSSVHSYVNEDAKKIVISNSSSTQLDKEHFVYKPTGKEADPSKQGIFGGGMKDAICMFKLMKLDWHATHGTRGFRLVEDLHQDGSVQIQPFTIDTESSTQDVVMEVCLGPDTEVTLPQLQFALREAQQSNWHWLLETGCIEVVHEFRDRGTVAKWVEDHRPKQAVAFSFGTRYVLENTKPLLLAVNLVTKHRKHVGGRDRLFIPDWQGRTRRLVTSVFTKSGAPKQVHIAFADFVTDKLLTGDWWECGQAVITDKVAAVIEQLEEDHAEDRENGDRAIQKLRKELERTTADGETIVEDFTERVAAGDATSGELEQAKGRVAEMIEDYGRQIVGAEEAQKQLPKSRRLVGATSTFADLEGMRPIFQPKNRARFPTLSDIRSAPGSQLTAAMVDARRKLNWLFRATGIDPAKVEFVADCQGASRWDVHTNTLFLVEKSTKKKREYISEAVSALDMDCAKFSAHDGLVCSLLNDASSSHMTGSTDEEQSPLPERNFRPLVVIDEWGTRTGGIAAFNMQLVKDLAKRGDSSVYLYASNDPNAIPKIANVAVIRHSSPQTPNFVGCNFNVIIGHAHHKLLPTFSDIAKSERGRVCDKWLFLHTVPEDTGGTSKSDTEEAESKAQAIKDVLSSCDRVFSVGKKIHGNWDGIVVKSECVHHTFYPVLNELFVSGTTTENARQVLCFGRFDLSKGMDILKPTFEAVRKVCGKVKFVLRGPKDVEAARQALDVDSHSFVIRKYASQVKVQEDLSTAAICLMPSFNEPFGLVGLEALAAGVVPLVSKNSGLAEYLMECGSAHAELRHMLIDNDGPYAERVEKWTDAVLYWLKMPGVKRMEIVHEIRDQFDTFSTKLNSIAELCTVGTANSSSCGSK